MDSEALDAHNPTRGLSLDTTPSSLLCDHCQLWDDLRRFEPSQGTDISLEEMLIRKHCIICDAITKAVLTLKESKSVAIRTWSSSRVLVRNQGPFFLDYGAFEEDIPIHRVDVSNPTVKTIRLLISLELRFQSDGGQDSSDQAETELMKFTPQFCLRYSVGQDPRLRSIKPWEVPYFNVPLLKKWTGGCEEVHRGLCDEDPKGNACDLPRGFRLIDLNEMKIVELASEPRYVALSYMWPMGKDNDAQLEKANLKDFEAPGGVAKISLPAIVSDAIALCKELGENYLWIDRICIVQDDAINKHDQIRGMDRIYQSASFSIIAALNSRDGRGLPGFKTRQRCSSVYFPARSCEIEGRGVRPNGMEKMVDGSLWNNRGWTFQERVLSRRRLFITDFQVVFECGQGHAFEELTYYPQQPLRVDDYESSDPAWNEKRKQERIMEEQEFKMMPFFSKRSTYGGGINYNMNRSTGLSSYFDWVENYTSRQLSFGTDILNAYTGVGNALGESLKSPMILGLPERYLPQALMWSTTDFSKPRSEMPQIPSWSWAASSDQVNYYWINGSSTFKDDLAKVATVVFYYYQDPEKGLRKLDIGERWIENEVSLAEATSHPQLPSLTGKYMPGDWRTFETWSQCPHSPWQALTITALDPEACAAAKSLPGSLVFNTTAASLRIGHHFEYDRMNKDAAIRNAAIFDANGQHVGQVHGLPASWIEEQATGSWTHEFIVLCGALANWRERKTMAQYLRDFDMWRLHVMLVERLNYKPYVVRRVKVGYVFAHGWKNCNPRWETVVLV